MLIAKAMQIIKKLFLIPGRGSFDAAQLPLPHLVLGGEPAKHDGHLHGHQNAKTTEHHHDNGKDVFDRLPRNQEANRRHENRIRGEIVGKQTMLITNA